MGQSPLTLIATSDLHGALPAPLRAQLRAAPGPVLRVDNGDLFGGASGLQLSLEGGACGMAPPGSGVLERRICGV